MELHKKLLDTCGIIQGILKLPSRRIKTIGWVIQWSKQLKEGTSRTPLKKIIKLVKEHLSPNMKIIFEQNYLKETMKLWNLAKELSKDTVHNLKLMSLFVFPIFSLVIIHAVNVPWTHDLTLHLALTRKGGAIWARAHWLFFYVFQALIILVITLYRTEYVRHNTENKFSIAHNICFVLGKMGLIFSQKNLDKTVRWCHQEVE